MTIGDVEMKKQQPSLCSRLGLALALANADLDTRAVAIREFQKVMSGKITEDQMDPAIRSLLSGRESKKKIVLTGKRQRKGSDAK